MRHRPLELNMFAEMQSLASNAPDLAAAAILRMATINGAQGLGRKGNFGELSPKALADLISIPFAGRMAEVHEAVVHHSGEVSASMINGQWTIKPG
jgi:cytosine/adenosine deaminase-related metal-dependent hydrolase